MKTHDKTEGATTPFILADVDPALHAVRGLACNPTPEGFAKRYLTETPDLERSYSSTGQSQPSDGGPAGRLERVRWRGHDLHVPPLDLQLEVSRRRCLEGQVAKIEMFLREHPSEIGAGDDARA